MSQVSQGYRIHCKGSRGFQSRHLSWNCMNNASPCVTNCFFGIIYCFAYFVTVVRHAVCQDFATQMHRFVCCIVFPQKRKLVVFCHSKGPGAGRSSQIRTAQGWEPGSQEGVSFSKKMPQVPKNRFPSKVPRNTFPSKVSKRFPKGSPPHTHSLQTEAFRHRNFYSLFTRKLLHRDAFTNRSFYTEVFTQRSLLNRAAFTDTEAFTQRSFCTEKHFHRQVFVGRNFEHKRFLDTSAFTQRSLCADQLLHSGLFSQSSVCAEQLLHTEALTQRGLYTEKLVHTEGRLRTHAHRCLYTEQLWHTDAFTQRSRCTEQLLHSAAFTHRRLYTKKLFYTNAFTHRGLYAQKLLSTEVLHGSFTQRSFTQRSV